MIKDKYMTKAEFIKDVAHEVKMLKKHATPEEILNIQFDNLDPSSKYECIYGMATGYCRSDRAIKLITKCCKRVVGNQFSGGDTRSFANAVKPFINGKPNSDHLGGRCDYISTMESYIMLPTAKNKNIIDFLKGEKKTLSL